MTTGVSRVEGGRVESLFTPSKATPPGTPGSTPGPAKETKPSAPMKIN